MSGAVHAIVEWARRSEAPLVIANYGMADRSGRSQGCARHVDDEPITKKDIELRKAADAVDGELDVCWLVCEWPAGRSEPTKYWLSNVPAETPLGELVSLAKLRWRIEQDYRELKDALGVEHFEGRSWRGWQHHVTLVSVAHAFLTT